MGTADAVAREAAWLATAGDGLPALRTADSGPFQIVQAYRMRSPNNRQTALWVLRPRMRETRVSIGRKFATYDFRLRLYWPIGATTVAAGIWETEQQALDNAVELTLRRIRAFEGDKTHGGRFLSVAETADGRNDITVDWDDPDRTADEGYLGAHINYSADDQLVAV